MKKYVVIDTWNGEGYSTENGVDIKQFDYRKSALKWAYKRALTNAQDDADDVQRYSDQTDLMKANDNGDGYFWETYDDNCGSYQVWETKDVYAFMIQCNVNDVTPLTKKQFIEEIEDKEDLMKDAITHSPFNESEEDFESQEENGDVYYGGLDDYDYQYRLVSNMFSDFVINLAIAEDEVTPVYIDFLNKEKGFKEDRIKFDSYALAVKWAETNFDKFNHDMIKYE